MEMRRVVQFKKEERGWMRDAIIHERNAPYQDTYRKENQLTQSAVIISQSLLTGKPL